MKDILKFSFLLFMFLGVFASCGDDEDVLPIDEEWKEQNTNAFLTRSFDETNFQRLDSESGDGYILYRVIEEGEGTEQIYYTSTVEVYYKGCLIRDEEGNIIENQDEVLEKGVVFDSVTRESGSEPVRMSPTGVIDGWATALQHMHVGDRWEIWIPYQLAYGVSGSSQGEVTILPYTTLVFDLEVAGIAEQ